MYTTNNELYHKGIRGMRWGVQNGPPYPLSDSLHKKVVSRKKGSSNPQVSQSSQSSKMRTVGDLKNEGYKPKKFKSYRLNWNDQKITQQKYEYAKVKRDRKDLVGNGFITGVRKELNDAKAKRINRKLKRTRDKVDRILKDYNDKGLKVYSHNIKRKADMSTVETRVSVAYSLSSRSFVPVISSYRTITQRTIDRYSKYAINRDGKEYFVFAPPEEQSTRRK